MKMKPESAAFEKAEDKMESKSQKKAEAKLGVGQSSKGGRFNSFVKRGKGK